MANEIQWYGDPNFDSGLTAFAQIFQDGLQVGADVTLTEVGTSAKYLGDMPTAPAGTYVAQFFRVVATNNLFVGQVAIHWNGTRQVTEQTLNNTIVNTDEDEPKFRFR